MNKVIGYVDTRWKPPRKSKVEQQIEKEDMVHWANREVAMVEYDYTPVKFNLGEVAKHVFGSAIQEVKALRKI